MPGELHDEPVRRGLHRRPGQRIPGGAALRTDCHHHVASYELQATTQLDAQYSADVHPGDTLVLSMSQTPSDTVATVADITSGATATAHDGSGDVGEPIREFNLGVFADGDGATPRYHTIRFHSVRVDGLPLDELNPSPRALDLQALTDRQESTSPITGAGGGAFTMTFLRAR